MASTAASINPVTGHERTAGAGTEFLHQDQAREISAQQLRLELETA